MSSDAGANGGLFERLLRTNEEQAKASGTLVQVLQEQRHELAEIRKNSAEQTRSQERQTQVMELLARQLEEMDSAREAAVKVVKDHTAEAIKAGFTSSENWWRRALWIAVGLITLSNVLDVALERIVAMLK